MTDTKQTDTKGRFVKGNTVAKDKGVDFGSKPENRHNGAWKKSDTLRFKIEKASELDSEELQAIVDDPKESMLLRKFAEATLKADWKMIKEITEMLYGKPKESVDISNPDGSLTPKVALVKFVNGKDPK